MCRLRIKMPLNWVASGAQLLGSHESWMTMFESARVVMAAWAIVFADSSNVASGVALFSSTRPPRITPWL